MSRESRLSVFRIWQQMLNFSESLSVLLSDDQFSGNLTRLFTQLNQLNDSTSVWNGKPIGGERLDEDLLFSSRFDLVKQESQ